MRAKPAGSLRIRFAAVLLTLTACAVTDGHAQLVDAMGANQFFGLAINASAIDADQIGDGSTLSGQGLTLTYGRVFWRRLVAFLDGGAARIPPEGASPESWMLAHGNVGLRVFGFVRERSALFVQGTVSVKRGTWPNVELEPGGAADIEISAAGVALGLGGIYFRDARTAFTVDYRFMEGAFASAVNRHYKVATHLVNFGVNWFLGRR